VGINQGFLFFFPQESQHITDFKQLFLVKIECGPFGGKGRVGFFYHEYVGEGENNQFALSRTVSISKR
jgi:hypothetical protein